MNKDLVCGGTALVLAIGYYILADGISASVLSDEVGPDGLPKAYAYILAALSLILIARSVAQRRLAPIGPAPDPAVRAAHRIALRRAAGMLGIGVLYVVMLPTLGYVLSLAILIAATTYYPGGAVTRQLAIVAVCGAAFFWAMFVWLLHIPQPVGLWPELF
jgi:putative tricarboxylic transport membrane protein